MSTSYQPLGPAGYSPALVPTRSSDVPMSDRLNLYDTNQSSSRSPSPQPGGEYDNYRYNNSSELESKGLVTEPEYRLYKRRWIGLAELTLLNFAVGWGYAAPGVVSSTATKWYGISFQDLNNLSIVSSLVFLIPAPFTIWTLNRYGPKMCIIIACVLTVIGNWVIFAGAATKNFPVNIAGTVIHSLASPFIMASPTRYSRQWFGDKGRTLATALPSLAYPLGSGIGALSGPYMVKPVGPLDYSGQALIIALVFTAAAIPAPFLPKSPPTPPSNVSTMQSQLTILENLKSLFTNPVFYLQFIGFSIFAGAIDTVISVTNQALEPYGYPQTDAGCAIAILIFVGVAVACLVSPILDRTGKHLIALKVIVLLIATGYTILPFMPATGSIAAFYIIYALIGAACLSVEPCVLALQADWTHPVSPEFSSVIGWCGAKATGAIFIVLVGDVLVIKDKEGAAGQPYGSLFYGLIFIATACWVCVPISLMNGVWIFKRSGRSQFHTKG